MSSEARQVRLSIRQIRLDGGTQIREKLNREVVREYSQLMRERVVFPPVIVVFDGENYWLADGFHRLHALLLLERTEIDCLVYEGSQRDAILVAVKANTTHGLRRTNKDKRRAVELILADEEWSERSTRWVAETCGVGQGLVEEVRRQLPESGSRTKADATPLRRGQDGKLRAANRAAGSQESDDLVGQALKCGEAFDACLKLLRRVANDAERLASGVGGRFLQGMGLANLRQHIAQAAETIAAARPSHRCGVCNGAGCEGCQQAGWMCSEKQRLDASNKAGLLWKPDA